MKSQDYFHNSKYIKYFTQQIKTKTELLATNHTQNIFKNLTNKYSISKKKARLTLRNIICKGIEILKPNARLFVTLTMKNMITKTM